uniref:VLIG-type G domain-containing protein n=1 Tax=Monopterus albus TaxID=43700 RepID=A0A3Q3Q076_MONAL
SFSEDALRNIGTRLGLNNTNIILKTRQKDDADFVQNLRRTISDVIENTKMKMQIEQMADVAHECQNAKRNADAITAKIQDTLKYKEAQLPLQGQIWKELTNFEKEEFRLQKVGSQNIEEYRSDLQEKKAKHRESQNSYNMSKAMSCFISSISSQGTERCYFLKWMRMNLDNLSQEKLSDLRELYKQKCKDSEEKEEIKDIDRQLSNSSLGTEHFFPEMGQIYEASLSLPETHPSRQQLQHLPKLCAGLLLDGFPLELVDGDASSIPLRWVSDVLSQMLVVTVLGKNFRDRKLLLQQLMEYKSFTDVMEYSPDTGNWYIPGLWNGNPPMTPVSVGYSEAVYEVKKNTIQSLRSFESSANNILEFTEWMRSLWTAVKHENFIFSFRNSLVADAYMRLCTEFNRWEWEFKKDMYTVHGLEILKQSSHLTDLRELLISLKSEACEVVSKWETTLLDNLT